MSEVERPFQHDRKLQEIAPLPVDEAAEQATFRHTTSDMDMETELLRRMSAGRKLDRERGII